MRKNDLWPKEFDSVNEEDHEHQEDEHIEDEIDDDQTDGDGIVYDQGYADDDDLILNTNRAAKLTLEDSSEDESDQE